MKTELLDPKDITLIHKFLKESEVIAFPTDTVYGIGVIYNDEIAINKMKLAKDRDLNKPFPLMVSNYQQLTKIAKGINQYENLIKTFMPGPLTIIVKKRKMIPNYITNNKDTIAIRMPNDKWLLNLLNDVGPLLVTSANISGRKEANTHKEVLNQLSGRIKAIIKGEAKSKIASTIIDLTINKPKILREGQITEKELQKYL